MSNESKRAEGVAEEIGGKIKKGIGSLIGNDQMHAEGVVKEKEGEAKQEAAKAAERTKGKVQEIVGHARALPRRGWAVNPGRGLVPPLAAWRRGREGRGGRARRRARP